MIEQLEKQIQGFPKGDYIKTWDFSSGLVLALNSSKNQKTLTLCFGDKSSNELHKLGLIDREKAQKFIDIFVYGKHN